MAIGTAPPSRRGAGRRARRPALWPAILMALVALGACSPVEAWRDLTGVSKDDPNPATTPNTKNLVAGEAAPYPNLATVPPPPTEALTKAELDKLTQSLIADRANAKYTDERLRAGFSVASAPPPPPPPPLPPEPPSAKPAAAPTPSIPAPPAAPGVAAAGSKPAATPSGGATAAAQGPRKPGEPPEPGPMESSLQSPQVPSTPPPEQYQPPPPPPRLMTPPAAPPAPNAPPAAAHLPAPPAPASLPAAVGSATYQPPPPPPVLAPIPAPSQTAMVAGTGKSSANPTPPTVFTPVAEIKFAAASQNLSDSDKQTLEKVVALYRQNPGQVRVVGYAGAGSGATDQLGRFRAALDRAQAVAAALTKTGIPSDKILAEAAPAGGQSGASRAEVLLGH